MPALDKTGPMGTGPLGRGRGGCHWAGAPYKGRFGFVRRRRQRWFVPLGRGLGIASQDAEMTMLEKQIEEAQQRLNILKADNKG